MFLNTNTRKPHFLWRVRANMAELKTDNKKPVDEYAKAIGELGKWQIFVFFITAFPIKLVLPSIQFGVIYMAPKTTFMCLERDNVTAEIVNKTCYSDCKQYEYYSEFENSIISQWDLICDRAWLADFAQTVLMFGVLIGSVIFGYISDRYGRRLTLIYSGTLETCMSFVMPFCPDYWSFIAVRFLLGTATGGTMMTSYVLLMEIFGPKKRDLLGAIYMLPLTIGQLIVSIISYYFRSWREFTIALAIPTLVYLTYVFYLPESPKWLISVGRLEEATATMETAAKWNNLPTDNMKAVVEKVAEEGRSNKENARKATLVDLCFSPSLRWKNLMSCLIWFSCGFAFYGSTQYFGQTTPNLSLAFGILGLIQAPGFLIGGYLSYRFGRKITIIALYLLNGVCNFVLILPDDFYWVKMVAGIISSCSGGASFCLLYLFTSELFPTVARNMAMGSSSTMNRVGSMLAPFVSGARVWAYWIPPVVFGFSPLIGVVACCVLPETKGKKLEDQLDDD